MVEFWPHVVKPLLEAAAPDVIVEVGAATGSTTQKLLEFAARHDCVVHSIDPNPDESFDLEGLRQAYGDRFVFHRELSLEALPRIKDADAVLLDGDHNWYTVYHELETLAKNAADAGREFPLTLLHDIDWPYGRRDFYYNPEAIPTEYRQPFERAGVVFGEDGLVEGEGLSPGECHAVAEGTPRNGVRTAVEDMLANSGSGLRFQSVTGFHGLGILTPERRLAENEDLRRLLESLEPAPLREQCVMLEDARLRTHRRLRETMNALAKARRAEMELRRQLKSRDPS